MTGDSATDEIADEDLAAQLRRNGERQGAAPKTMRRPFDHHRQPEGQEQAQDRIGAIEAAKQQALGRDPDHADDDRRDNERTSKADPRREDDREIGADGVEPAVRQIDDAAEREDQRKPKRNKQIVGATRTPLRTCSRRPAR